MSKKITAHPAVAECANGHASGARGSHSTRPRMARRGQPMDGLKPCPFCGGAAEIMPHSLTGKFSVIRATCQTCYSHHHNGVVLHEDAKDHQIESARAIAVQQWNQRHEP